MALAESAISQSDLTLVLLDPIDFTGTLIPKLFNLAEGKLVVVLTKMDLLPPIAKRQEIVEWVREELALYKIRPLAIFPLSSKSGMGIPELISFLKKKKSRKVAIVGATNVGKSALLERLLPQDAAKPTVSTLAGTTLDLNPRKFHSSQILDTPGITPVGRLDHYLCSRCQSNLIPAAPINSKLYELGTDQALLFGTFGCVSNHGEETLLQVYLPGKIKLHRTNFEKAQALLKEQPLWLGGGCRRCPPVELKAESFTLKPLEDLAIAGLGWLSVRRTPCTLEALLPPGIRTQIRPALLQKR